MTVVPIRKSFLSQRRHFTGSMNLANIVTLFICLFFIILNSSKVLSMTRQQLKNSGKIMKKSCMPKNDVTEDQVGAIAQGKFHEEKNVMCYIACIYSMGQVVKNNKLNYDGMVKQVDMMFPMDTKDAAKSAIEKCRSVANNYKDICEVSYWTAKCLYDTDPANFFFP